jgi:hypothetical protein
MDSFNSNFSPFDSSDQEQDRKNREEAERQKQEAEKLAKQKAEQAERQKKAEAESTEAPEKRESFFSIKYRVEKATEKASKKNKDEKFDPKKLTSEIAKDEDNFSEEERVLIKLKKEAIADRAKQLTEQSHIPENKGAKSESRESGANEPLSLSQEEALSLAIAEALSGDLDEIEPTISESEPTKLGDILLAAATRPGFDRGIESAEPDSEKSGEPTKETDSEDEEYEGAEVLNEDLSYDISRKPDAGANLNQDDNSIESKPEPDQEEKPVKLKPKIGSRLLSFVGISTAKTPKTKLKNFGGGGPSGAPSSPSPVNTNTAPIASPNQNQSTPNSKSANLITDALSISIAKKVLEGARKSRINQTPEIPEDLAQAQEYIRQAAPKSDRLKMRIEEEVDVYGQRETTKMVDRPIDLGRSAENKSEPALSLNSSPGQSPDYRRHDSYQYESVAESADSKDLDLMASGFSEIEISPRADSYIRPQSESFSDAKLKPASPPELINNEASRISIKQFERYLDGLLLKYHPKSAKDLQRKVKKDYGRNLSLAEMKNVDNYWAKKQAQMLNKSPEILGGPDQRRVEAEENIAKSISPAGSSTSNDNKNANTNKKYDNQNPVFSSGNSVNSEVKLKDNDYQNKIISSGKNTAANVVGIIFIALVLIYVIAYAIILLN